MTINGTKTPPTREQIKERRRRVRDQLELQKLEQMESILWDGFGGSDLWFSLRDRFGGADGQWGPLVPLSVVTDRRKGQNWPLWRTEVELGELRQRARIVCQSNDAAICLLGNLQNHIVGKGFTYKCQPKKQLDKSPDDPGVQAGAGADQVVDAVQAFIDRFLAVNRWTATINPSLLTSPGIGSRERETVRRTYRDGEAFLRLFQVDGGMTYVRFVEPEQITQNGGANMLPELGWSFGIQHAMEPFEDEERTTAYHVQYKSLDSGEDAMGEIVPAGEMVHVKLPDEDAAIKRGTPAFSFDTLDAFVRGTKLQRNLSVSAQIQAATAEIWKHNQGTASQISSIAQQLSERQITNPVTGKTENVERLRPGSIRRIPFGLEPVQPAYATGSKSEFIAVTQADFRAGSRAFQAPEYFTGDASNANYSSTKEAGTPWVIASEVIQTHFGAVFAFVVWKAIAYAVECGQLPAEALKVVELQVEPTAVPPTDPLQAAQENQIYIQSKVKSRKTAQMELGLDPDHENANIEEDEQRFGMGGNPLAAMMGGDQGDSGGNNPPAMAESLLEGEWDENKHPRDHGKFSSTPGASGEAASSKKKGEPKQAKPSSPRTEEEKPLLAPVTSVKHLGGGVNTSRIITMEGGGMGVFKPVEGETHNLRAEIPNGTLHYREAAAAHVAGVLDLHDLVPATTVRDVDGKEGSVQAFVSKSSVANIVQNPFDGEKDHARAAAFDYLIAQTDRHPGNWMLTHAPSGGIVDRAKQWFSGMVKGDKMALIDNGLSLPTAEKSVHMQNQDLLRGAVNVKIPAEIAKWESKRGQVEQSLRANKLDDAAVGLAMKRFDAIVKTAKAGGTFGDLPYAGMSVKQITAATPQGFRVRR